VATGALVVGAGLLGAVVGIGAGVAVVATVAGAPHAVARNAINNRRELDGLMTDPGLRNIRRTITGTANGGQPLYAFFTASPPPHNP
jgi:hypothetical protein